MKFKKFSKSITPGGIVSEYGGEKWLYSGGVLMPIPPMVTITAAVTMPIAPEFKDALDEVGNVQLATLSRAIMPFPDGGIKDCIRRFTSIDDSVYIDIRNDDWSLLEKSDIPYILYSYDMDADRMISKALLIKSYATNPADDDDDNLVGVILPVHN